MQSPRSSIAKKGSPFLRNDLPPGRSTSSGVVGHLARACLTRILREESVTRGTEPCAKWPHGVLPEERRYIDIVAQGKTSTAAGCAGLGLVVANLTQYPG